MTDRELTILNYIENRCRGKANAETFKHLSLLLGIGERELRDIVAHMVADWQIPIASGSDCGYYWLTTDQEFIEAHRELISRIKKLAKRAKGLRIGYLRSKQEIKPKQLTFV